MKFLGNVTSSTSRMSSSALLSASSIRRLKLPKTLLASVSYLSLLIVEVKSIPSARLSALKLALPPILSAFLVASASNFSFARLF